MVKERSVVIGFASWFIVGVTIAGTVQVLRAGATGGVEGLVTAGALEPAHVVVVEHLPSAPVAEDHGHDGQIFFAIGSDLTASTTPPSIVPPYRYRRILYPAIAGLFGLLGGEKLLWGMIVVASVGVGLAAGAVNGIASDLQFPWLAPLAVVLNPGTWLSAMFLTADNLALAFSLLAVFAMTRHRDGWAILALTAAALTKETHIIFAVGLAGYLWFDGERSRGLRYLKYPLISLPLWLFLVALRVGNPLASGDNLEIPLVGIYEALEVWAEISTIELYFTGMTLLGLVLAFVTLVRQRRLIGWLVAPWILLAFVSSHFVWDLGNNSIRTLGPLFTLGCLGLMAGRERTLVPPCAVDAGKRPA